MTKDYISREAAIAEARYRQRFYEKYHDNDFAEAFEIMGDKLRDLPSADVKPVVFCKDCLNNYGTKEQPDCDIVGWDWSLKPDDFCSNGSTTRYYDE